MRKALVPSHYLDFGNAALERFASVISGPDVDALLPEHVLFRLQDAKAYVGVAFKAEEQTGNARLQGGANLIGQIPVTGMASDFFQSGEYKGPDLADETGGNIMKYVLILILTQGVTSTTFDDYTACRQAAEKVRDVVGMDMAWYCVPQSSQEQGYVLAPK